MGKEYDFHYRLHRLSQFIKIKCGLSQIYTEEDTPSKIVHFKLSGEFTLSYRADTWIRPYCGWVLIRGSCARMLRKNLCNCGEPDHLCFKGTYSISSKTFLYAGRMMRFPSKFNSSLRWAHQPTIRAIANNGVKISCGKPIIS